MAVDFNFRKERVSKLTSSIGVYILADLDNIPLYVGQSVDGIRQRVQRHLTSARSDIIANRQVDVWEIAYVWEYPLEDRKQIGPTESILYHNFNPTSRLMNGTVPPLPEKGMMAPNPENIVQVMPESDRLERLELELRLPRQAKQYADIIGHFLAVKNSKEIRRAMDAHFERLTRYHAIMLGLDTGE